MQYGEESNKMRLHRLGLVIAALVVPVAVVVGSAGAVGAGVVTFQGTLQGDLSGSITFSPALTNTPSTGPITITTRATTSNLVGGLSQNGATILRAIIKSGPTAPAGATCALLESGFPTRNITFTYKVKQGGNTAAASLFYPSGPSSTSPSPLTITVGGHPHSTTKFSFAGVSPTNMVTFVIDQSLSALQSDCAASGVSSMTFTGVNGPSTFELG
jgi:hypothetical protein